MIQLRHLKPISPNFIKTFLDYFLSNKLKSNFLSALPYWVGAFITGILSVLYAKLFSLAENWSAIIFHAHNWSVFIITPVCFVISWWLVHSYSSYARGSGIPQVIAAIELSNVKKNHSLLNLLSFRILSIKMASSLVMIFGGGLIGREGPTIQISASIFKKVHDLLPNWYPTINSHNMIITGAAAGLASAFNTPLGGIVFAIEELTKTHFSFFKSALLSGVIISGLTALSLLGPYLYLGSPKAFADSHWIIFIVLLVALSTGILGASMGSLIIYVLRIKKSFPPNRLNALYPIGCGLVIASFAFFIDGRILGSGKEFMTSTLYTNEKYIAWYIPLFRFVGSILTFSTGGSGGIFAPSLSSGACIGSVISGWFQLSNPETNLIILCGMVGFLTGVTRSPFTSSILVIEMTNNHSCIFYMMLTALFSQLASKIINKHSMYEHLKYQIIHEIKEDEMKLSSRKPF